MRLDLFLKLTRLIPKRGLAKEFAKAGQIEVNGKTAKSAYSVKPDDVILIKRRNSTTEVRVISVPAKKQVAKKDAGNYYELLAHNKLDPLED